MSSRLEGLSGFWCAKTMPPTVGTKRGSRGPIPNRSRNGKIRIDTTNLPSLRKSDRVCGGWGGGLGRALVLILILLSTTPLLFFYVIHNHIDFVEVSERAFKSILRVSYGNAEFSIPFSNLRSVPETHSADSSVCPPIVNLPPLKDLKSRRLELSSKNVESSKMRINGDKLTMIASSKNSKMRINGDKLTMIASSKGEKLTMKMVGKVLTDDSLFDFSSRTKKKKNLVLGFAASTESENIAIFCLSFRQVDKYASLVIIINGPNVPEKHIEIAKMSDTTFLVYEHQNLPKYLQSYHASTLRWVLFDKLVSPHDGYFHKRFGAVLVADVRDTVFQANPFSPIADQNVLQTFGEETQTQIGQCGWNSGWVESCFGSRMLRLVSNNTVICSGITMGSFYMMSRYLRLMGTIMAGESELAPRFPACERNGVDQGVHNVLLHMGLVSRTNGTVTVLYEALSSQVAHMQTTQATEVVDFELKQIRNNTVVKTGDGSGEDKSMMIKRVNSVVFNTPVSIVHQYDRHFDIQNSLARQYIYWDNQGSAESLANDTYCGKYRMVPKRDLLRGVCDSGMARVISSKLCCRLCDERRKSNPKGCDAFALSEGSCYLKTCGQPFLNARLKNFTLFREIRKQRRERNLDITSYLQSKGMGLGGDFAGTLDIIAELARRGEVIGATSNTVGPGLQMDASLYVDFDLLTVDHVLSFLLFENDAEKWVIDND